MALGTSLFLIVFQHSVAQFLQIPSLYVVLLALFLIFEISFRLSLSILQGFQEMQKYSFFTVLTVIGELLFALLAVFFGYGLLGAVFAFLMARVFASCILFFLTVKKVGLAMPHFLHISKYLKFSIPSVVSALAFQGINLGNQNLIANFLGIAYVGYYAPAYSFAALLSMAYFPTSIVLPPLLASLFANRQTQEIQTFLSKTVSYILFLLIPAVAGFFGLSRSILEIFSTSEIAVHAQWALPVLGVSFIFYGMYTVFVQVLGLFLKTHYVGTIWVLAAITNLFLNIFLLPRFGILGSAMSTALSFFLAFSLTAFVSRKLLPFPFHWKNATKSILCSLVMLLIIILIHPTGILATFLTIAGSVIFYVFSMLLLKGITVSELKYLESLLFSRFLKRQAEK